MKTRSLTSGVGALIVVLLIGRYRAQRRRSLALMPRGVSLGRGLTMRRAMADARWR